MSGVLRADTTPRASGEGPFGHLDIRWIVDRDGAGAERVAFGQTTYPGGPPGEGATHELHYHPNAEEVVLVTSGHAEQVVGDETLRMGPGDVCFVPAGVPHRVAAASEEDLVILWVLGGASTLAEAGYVPVPDPAAR